jgi:hypothetical protein
MNVKQYGSWWLSILRLDSTPIYVFTVAASLGILSQMISGFKHDIFSDDAYYYTVVARNFVQSGHFSFDGLSETNGFHPLLFWVQVVLAAVLGSGVSPFGFYTALLLFYAIVLFIFVIMIAHVCRTLARTTTGNQFCYILILSIGFCFLPRNLVMFYGGMESTLAFPLCVFTVILVYSRKYIAAGLLGAFLVAARLDTFPYLLVPMFSLYSLHEWHKRRDWFGAVSTFLRLISPAVVFIVLFLVFNYVYYGAGMPITSGLKSTFPRMNIQWHYLQGHYPALCVFMALIGGGLLLYSNQIKGRLRFLGLAFVLVTLTQLASFFFFQKWAKPIPFWYKGLPLFTAVAGLSFGLANHLSQKVLRIAALCCSCLITLVNAETLIITVCNASNDSQFEIANGTMNETIDFMKSRPKDELWAYTDCGQLAFWSDRRVVNLDGVINDFEYQDCLRRQELEAYLKEKGVRYLVAGIWDRRQTENREYELMYKYRVAPKVYSGDYDSLEFYVYSYLYHTYSEKLRLPRAAEVWRSSEHMDGKARARFVVYDLKIATEYSKTHDIKG